MFLAARSQSDLEGVRSQIAASNPAVKVEIGAVDLRSSDALRDLAKRAGDIDILVNCAGDVPHGHLSDLDEAKWRSGWELKIFGYINLTREVFPGMVARKRGVIVNIVGTAAQRPDGAAIATATGNAALMAFTKALSTDAVPHGVRVVGINPAGTETDRQMVRWKAIAKEKFGDEGRWRDLTKGYPFGRLARADEVASVATFLASERASYVSGTVVTVDGGANRTQ